MDFRIRLAAKGDTGTILTLIMHLAAYERMSHEVVATEDDLSKALFSSSPSAHVLIAETTESHGQPSRPVGFALYFFNFSTFVGRPGLYLEDLFVLPDYRHRGIGQALFCELAAIAVTKECGRMEWSVLNWNESAIGFYKKLGSVPMNEWTVYRLSGQALRKCGTGKRRQTLPTAGSEAVAP